MRGVASEVGVASREVHECHSSDVLDDPSIVLFVPSYVVPKEMEILQYVDLHRIMKSCFSEPSTPCSLRNVLVTGDAASRGWIRGREAL